MSTYMAKQAEIENNWIVIDATDAVLGRLSSFIAKRLQGKHRPDYTPHADCGDNIIVINADKVAITGNKKTDKIYYRHTGYPGGLKEKTFAKIIESDRPEGAIKLSVKRMMPKDSSLSRQQFSKLHVFAGEEHKHEAQKPKSIDFVNLNSKNKIVEK